MMGKRCVTGTSLAERRQEEQRHQDAAEEQHHRGEEEQRRQDAAEELLHQAGHRRHGMLVRDLRVLGEERPRHRQRRQTIDSGQAFGEEVHHHHHHRHGEEEVSRAHRVQSLLGAEVGLHLVGQMGMARRVAEERVLLGVRGLVAERIVREPQDRHPRVVQAFGGVGQMRLGEMAAQRRQDGLERWAGAGTRRVLARSMGWAGMEAQGQVACEREWTEMAWTRERSRWLGRPCSSEGGLGAVLNASGRWESGRFLPRAHFGQALLALAFGRPKTHCQFVWTWIGRQKRKNLRWTRWQRKSRTQSRIPQRRGKMAWPCRIGSLCKVVRTRFVRRKKGRRGESGSTIPLP